MFVMFISSSMAEAILNYSQSSFVDISFLKSMRF